MKTENGATIWKSENEIDVQKLERILEIIEEFDSNSLQPELSQEEQDKIQKELREKAWEEANSSLEKIDNHRFDFNSEEGRENYNKFIEEIKNLPPNEIVSVYHGLNNGGYESVLDILNSPSRGIEQRSGPTLSFVPLGQFWKGLGFKYSLRRDQVKFPGESNPNAIAKFGDPEIGVSEDVGYIITPEGSLPLDQFDAKIMRSELASPNPVLEKEMMDKLQQFSEVRLQQNQTNTTKNT